MKQTHMLSFFISLIFVLVTACTPMVNGPLNPPAVSGPGQSAHLSPPKACTPPKIIVDQTSNFCANPSLGLGGATIAFHNLTGSLINQSSGDVNCQFSSSKLVCYGPKNEKFVATVCNLCVPPFTPENISYTCSKGYADDGQGHCLAVDPNHEYPICPSGSHYSNDLQDCIDDVSGDLASPCPTNTTLYSPFLHMCISSSNFHVVNCQTFQFTLGDCPVQVKQKNHLGPGGNQSCGAGSSWDGTCCRDSLGACQ
jgi:hypothetical protein